MGTTKIRTKRKQCRVCQDDTDLDIVLGGKEKTEMKQISDLTGTGLVPDASIGNWGQK